MVADTTVVVDEEDDDEELVVASSVVGGGAAARLSPPSEQDARRTATARPVAADSAVRRCRVPAMEATYGLGAPSSPLRPSVRPRSRSPNGSALGAVVPP